MWACLILKLSKKNSCSQAFGVVPVLYSEKGLFHVGLSSLMKEFLGALYLLVRVVLCDISYKNL